MATLRAVYLARAGYTHACALAGQGGKGNGETVTIQPAPQGEKWKYRVNLYNDRTIERKLNKRGGRWERWQVFTTPEAARNAILSLQKQENEDDD